MLDGGSISMVVGVAYDHGDDSLPWREYWELAADASGLMADALHRDGRAWVNTAVSVPESPRAT